MNKPDSYMPMYWLDFWQAVRGWPETAIIGYQKALTHYWFHEHCQGLSDNPDMLRLICERSEDDWQVCMEFIFDNRKAFKKDEETGMWHQYRCLEEWNKAELKYKKVLLASHAGVMARRTTGSLPSEPTVKPTVLPPVKRRLQRT